MPGQPAPQTKRVIAGLRAIGLPRESFRARLSPFASNGTGVALGHTDNPKHCRRIVRNAHKLASEYGLVVHVLEYNSAFVSTPRAGQRPGIVRYAAVSSPVLGPPGFQEVSPAKTSEAQGIALESQAC